MFAIFGPSVLGLSLLKNLLLFSTCMLTFASARIVTRWEAAAVTAALSLFYFPSFAWESQRDLTHSVLASTASLATLFCFLQLLESRQLKWYIVFGLCGGLGTLAKYNYALWFVGLLIGGMFMQQFRPALSNWRLLLSVGITMGIVLPNVWWALNHPDLAFLTSFKFQVNQTLSTWQAMRIGFKNVFQSLLSFVTPLTIIYLLVFYRRPTTAQASPQPDFGYRTLLLRSWIAIGVLLLGVIIVFHATGLKERWFQPILIALPILASSFAQKHLTAIRLKWILGFSGTAMLSVLLIMPGRLMLAGALKREEPLTRPYAELALDIRAAVTGRSLIVCESRHLAGNLKLGLPEVTVISPELTPLFGGGFDHCYLAWDARTQDGLPFQLKSWAEANKPFAAQGGFPQYFSEQYQYHQTKQFRLGFQRLY